MHMSQLSVVVSCLNLFSTCMQGRRMHVLRNIDSNIDRTISSLQMTRSNRVPLTRFTLVKRDRECSAR